MGLTAYDKFTGEPAHRHSVAKEYAYVISGRTQYMDLDTREIYEYHAGDFFATFPGTTYVQKSEAGTKMIFVKEPSINDKGMYYFFLFSGYLNLQLGNVECTRRI